MTLSDVLAAFTRIREAAEHHMDELDSALLPWSEETVTEVCRHRGAPEVKVIPFNRRQEGSIGADYLWWFVDQTSSVCFGMLVQAKRLTRSGERWQVDVGYRDGQQFHDLLATSDQLQVPAMYGIYTGGRVFRADLPCAHGKAPDCLACRRVAISMISAYQLHAVVSSPSDTAAMVFSDSVALEDLVDPRLQAGLVPDLNLRAIPAGPLRNFLLRDQDGPTEVAKRIFSAVSDQRRRSFSAATAEASTLPDSPLFPQVPADSGHFPGPYYRHFLRGLRASPPTYVRQLQRSMTPEGTSGYVAALPRQPRPPGRPRELQGVAVDGVVLVTV